MSRADVKSTRPVSPHLQVYRLIPTMLMSILHRITGAGLYFGMLLVAIWLVAIAGGAETYETVAGLFGSILGQLVLLGFTWTLIHHLLGGLRHLLWDTAHGMEPKTATTLAIANLVGSVVLTGLVWGIALALA